MAGRGRGRSVFARAVGAAAAVVSQRVMMMVPVAAVMATVMPMWRHVEVALLGRLGGLVVEDREVARVPAGPLLEGGLEVLVVLGQDDVEDVADEGELHDAVGARRRRERGRRVDLDEPRLEVGVDEDVVPVALEAVLVVDDRALDGLQRVHDDQLDVAEELVGLRDDRARDREFDDLLVAFSIKATTLVVPSDRTAGGNATTTAHTTPPPREAPHSLRACPRSPR
mmetsp:Transcript_20030/g.79897  ORF Transcript_20030/g.79897 Transcript_20030/m.79897 type:complete len:226 (-) Transcript_20030:793-1470(-)